MAGQVSRPKLDPGHTCLLLSCSVQTGFSHDAPFCLAVNNPHDKSQEGHSHSHWVAWSSTPKCMPGNRGSPAPNLCWGASSRLSHGSQGMPTHPVVVQGVHVADDLHQVLRANAVDSLLQQGTTRRGVRASRGVTEITGAERAETISSQASPVSWGHLRPVSPSPVCLLRDATLLTDPTADTEIPIAVVDSPLACGSHGKSQKAGFPITAQTDQQGGILAAPSG